jgi:hypothetical protein
MNYDAIAPNLNNLGRIHIYLLHLFFLVDYGYCRREFLAQQPQKAGTRRWDAPQVSLDIPLSFYPLSSSSNDNFLAAESGKFRVCYFMQKFNREPPNISKNYVKK